MLLFKKRYDIIEKARKDHTAGGRSHNHQGEGVFIVPPLREGVRLMYVTLEQVLSLINTLFSGMAVAIALFVYIDNKKR